MTLEEIQLQNLHYYFSTAPQVLGAILAITGAFVVFKLQAIKKEIFGASQQLLNIETKYYEFRMIFTKPHVDLFKHHHASQDIEGLYDDSIRAIEKAFKNQGEIQKLIEEKEIENKADEIEFEHTKEYESYKNKLDQIYFVKGKCYAIKSGYEQYNKFKIKTKENYIINGILLGVILLSFPLLPLANYGCKYWIMLIAGLLITSVSLALIIRYLIKSIDLTPKKKSIRN